MCKIEVAMSRVEQRRDLGVYDPQAPLQQMVYK